jgi:hypothetical protein
MFYGKNEFIFAKTFWHTWPFSLAFPPLSTMNRFLNGIGQLNQTHFRTIRVSCCECPPMSLLTADLKSCSGAILTLRISNDRFEIEVYTDVFLKQDCQPQILEMIMAAAGEPDEQGKFSGRNLTRFLSEWWTVEGTRNALMRMLSDGFLKFDGAVPRHRLVKKVY